MRAKYIVVSNSSLFEAGARDCFSSAPGGLAPVASVSEREGLEWPFDSAQVWGWRVGKEQACYSTLCWAWLDRVPLRPPWSL